MEETPRSGDKCGGLGASRGCGALSAHREAVPDKGRLEVSELLRRPPASCPRTFSFSGWCPLPITGP